MHKMNENASLKIMLNLFKKVEQPYRVGKKKIEDHSLSEISEGKENPSLVFLRMQSCHWFFIRKNN